MQVETKFIQLHEDYWDVAAWWIGHGWRPLPPGMLSNFGMMACVNGEKVAAAWLYFLTPGWAYIEWTVVNPSVSLRARYQGVKCILTELRDAAQRAGAGAISSSLHSPGLIRIFESVGFVEADKGMTNMILRVK